MRGIETNGEMIKRLRSARGYTQEELATVAQCDVKTLRKAESEQGRSDLPVLGRIATALNVELSTIAADDSNSDMQQQNIKIVDQWNAAFFARDLDLVMSFHHPDVELLMPNSEDLPGGGNYFGIDQVRQHMVTCFEMLDEYQLHSKQLHAVDDFVFLRSEASARVIATGERFGSFYSNEFRLRDGLIVHRTVITDYASMREKVEEIPKNDQRPN